MTRQIKTALIVAGLQLVVALLATAGRKLGYIDQDTTVRILMVSLGLMLLFSANSASKVVSRSARRIAAQRFMSWSMTSGALGWTLAWLTLPTDVATIVAMASVLLGYLAVPLTVVPLCNRDRSRTTP